MSELEDKAFRLRKKLNEQGLGHYGNKRWNQLIAAMDNIEDAAVGLDSLLENGIGVSTGEKYLRLFGVLQLVYSQQDSFMFIHKVVTGEKNFSAKPFHSWSYLRGLRNSVFGHPAGNGGAVSRITIRSDTFTVAVWDESKDKLGFEEVDFQRHLLAYQAEIGAQVDALVSLYPT
ncbi:hypothetical protein [Vreelandella glaciei]|uniref:hypothetical protein n=1 Tax=Vreelandella glaciei TaxID=186761 RepID=UPI003001A5AB